MPDAPPQAPAAPVAPSPQAVPPPAPQPGAPKPPAATPSIVSPAKQRAFEALRQRAAEGPDTGKKSVTEPAPKPPAAPSQEPPKPPVEPSKTPQEPPKPPGDTPTPPEPPKTPQQPPEAKGKTSPWKLVDKLKADRTRLETELLETRKQLGDPELVRNLSSRAEKAESRLKELESEMRHVNYAKTEEFKEKYQKPYETAWLRALSAVKELTVTDEDGNTRAGTPQDLAAIINLPLGPATAKARELFGDELGGYIMAHHYGRIRELADEQQSAIERVKKEGEEREKTQGETRRQRDKRIFETFHKVKGADESKYDFLKTKEGDDEWNSRLESAVNFVDETLSSPVTDEKLTPEALDDLIARHVGVRNRAIGFSMLRLENRRLKAELAERDKALAEYKGAEPGGGEGKPGAGSAEAGEPGDRMSAAKNRLRGYVNR